MKKTSIWGVFVIICTSCSARVAPDVGEEVTVLQSVTSSPIGPAIKGYRHDPGVSRFKLGGATYSESVAPGQRYVGTNGAIFVTSTGATIAVANADSGVEAVGPFSTDPLVHTSAVLSYFRVAGLPEEQIGSTHITTSMVAQGLAVSQSTQSRKLIGYTTIIDRQVGGVRVSGSYAWARLNANGDVMAEEVYWPDLPASVVTTASQLTVALANNSQRRALLSTLPVRWASAETESEVVIRHSPHYQAKFEAFAAVEVQSPHQPSPAWYDLNGRELRLASEMPQLATGSQVSK